MASGVDVSVDGDGGLGGGRCGEGAKGNVVQNETTAGEDRRSVGGRGRRIGGRRRGRVARD